MARDTGKKALRDDWPEGVVEGEEVEVIDRQQKTTGYIYLFYFKEKPERINWPKSIIGDDLGERYKGGSPYWETKGLNNVFDNHNYKTIFPSDCVIPKMAGGSGENFVDRIKFRFQIRLLFGLLKLKVNESSFIGEVTAWKQGPVRLMARNWATVVLPMSFKGPKLWMELYLYESFINAPINLKVPFNPGLVITDFSNAIGYDLNKNAEGMKFYNSNNLKGFIVNGKKDKDEKEMNTAIDDWRCVVGPQGSIMVYSIWDKEYRRQAELNVYFRDDLDDKVPPDSEPGSRRRKNKPMNA